MSVSHKIVSISTPSTAQPDSGIERLVAELSKRLPEEDAPLNRPELKDALTALLQSLPELEQTMSSADHSTLLYQTKAALALYDWVNPALGLQRDSSLKENCLLAAIEAHATITELLEKEAIDAAQIEAIGSRIFRTSVDLTTIDIVKQAYLDLRKTSVEARLHTMFQNLVSYPFTLMDSHALNPVPTAAEFTKKAAQLLTLLFETMCPGLAERSLPISDRWLALMAAAKGIEISPRIFDSVRATGPSGEALDTCLAILQNEAVKTAFGGLLSIIREKKDGVQDIIKKQRWETAEKRVGMAVETLLGKQAISSDQDAACCKLIDHWTGTVRGTCSVGVDLQLIDFQDELATIFGGVNQSTLNIKVASWVVARVSELLREKCALPQLFSQDVHHVNLAIRLILAHMGVSDSNDFSDPYEAGMRDKITAQKDRIAKEFLEVSPLLDTLHCSSGLSLDELVSGGAIKTGDTHALDPMAWRRLAESCMKELDFETFKSMGIGIPELDGKLGCHGLSGIAARLGKVDYFNEILKQQPIDKGSVFTRDVFDCTLMDYAALGGNVAILDRCMAGSAPNWDTLFADSPLPRNPLALAAESGNAAMVTTVAGLVGDEWTTRLMIARDQKGFDPLMRGVMSKNVSVVSQVMALLNEPDVRLETVNARNSDGQTPLILAIESGSPEITELLLGAEADPNARVSGSGDQISPLEWAMLKGNSAVVRVLLTHEGITLHESVIRYAANGECLLPFLDVACKRLQGNKLAFVLGTAIERGKLNTDDCMALCDMAKEKLTGCDLETVLSTALRYGKLNAADCMKLCDMANGKITGFPLAYVLSMAILDGKLTGDQCVALFGMASKKLTGYDLETVLSTAIQSGKLKVDNCMALCDIAISEKLTGSDLTKVLNAAIRDRKLTGDNYMALCRMAISKNLTGRDLAYVLSTALQSGELTGEDCMELCDMANEKLTGRELAHVLSMASKAGK